MPRRPWYPRYPMDFQTDEKVIQMTLEEQGAYSLLLDYHWIEGRLPNDPKKLAKILRVHPNKVRKFWGGILGGCFEKRGNDYLVNPRMEREVVRADEISNLQRDKALKRWSIEKPDAGAVPAGNAEPM